MLVVRPLFFLLYCLVEDVFYHGDGEGGFGDFVKHGHRALVKFLDDCVVGAVRGPRCGMVQLVVRGDLFGDDLCLDVSGFGRVGGGEWRSVGKSNGELGLDVGKLNDEFPLYHR